jgi:hypothetical protein
MSEYPFLAHVIYGMQGARIEIIKDTEYYCPRVAIDNQIGAAHEYEALRAENAKLRELLKELQNINSTAIGEGYGAWCTNSEAEERIAEALKENRE